MSRRAFYPVPFPQALPDHPDPGLAAEVDDYARKLMEFYDRRAHWHRRLYRATGVSVILIGAALPLMAAPSYPGKQIIVSLAGTVVAALTALRAFYRWDQSWILLRTTEMALTDAYWQWRAQIDGALRSEASGGQDARHAVTEAFLVRLTELRQREADSYFKDLSFPAPAHRMQ
jgi:hypothetical protein